MSACCTKQIQHATTIGYLGNAQEKLIIFAPMIKALVENFEKEPLCAKGHLVPATLR